MKIFTTSDLHYPRDKNSVERVVGAIDKNTDVVVIAGDMASMQAGRLDELLAKFRNIKVPKLAVAGNHDLWIKPNAGNKKYESSVEKYKDLGSILSRNGFHFLDEGPFLINGTGFAGNVGWYDYSFRPGALDINPIIHVGKITVEKYLNELSNSDFEQKYFMFEDPGRDPELQPGFFSWADLDYIRWAYSDHEFLELCLGKLEKDLKTLSELPEITKIVVITHHVPFMEMLQDYSRSITGSIGNCYMGSCRTGELISSFDKVKYVISGHSHFNIHKRINGIECINAGLPGKGQGYGTIYL